MVYKSPAGGNANLLESFFDFTLVKKSNSGIESRIAMTRTATGKLEGLEGFENSISVSSIILEIASSLIAAWPAIASSL